MENENEHKDELEPVGFAPEVSRNSFKHLHKEHAPIARMFGVLHIDKIGKGEEDLVDPNIQPSHEQATFIVRELGIVVTESGANAIRAIHAEQSKELEKEYEAQSQEKAARWKSASYNPEQGIQLPGIPSSSAGQ